MSILLDLMIEHELHAWVDCVLKAQLTDLAAEMSYRKSGLEPGRRAKGTEVSRQTVLNAVHTFVPEIKEQGTKEKRRVRVLYIEGDEEHAVGQDEKMIQVLLLNFCMRSGKGWTAK